MREIEKAIAGAIERHREVLQDLADERNGNEAMKEMTMTRDQLLAAVQSRHRDDMHPYVRLADIPEGPWVAEFSAALDALGHEPLEDETGTCAYCSTWVAFVESELSVLPSGLEPDDERPDLTPAQLRTMVPVHEPCAGVPARHVRVLDIPRPHRKSFLGALTGSTVPFKAGESALGISYAHDWLDWLAAFTPGWPEHGRRRP